MSRESIIRQTHAALTVETLEALANKGLVRRAQKDLERGEVADFFMMDAGLAAAVSGHRVTLVEAGPAKAACTCPAAGVCQHILAACLALLQGPGAEPAGDAHAEWLALTDAQILAAYGLPVLRAAYELNLAYSARIERSAVLTVRYPALNAEVIALPGAGLAGVIVNGLNERKHAQLAGAAVLAVRREAGLAWHPPVKDASRSGPAHGSEVLKAAGMLLEETVTAGLARLSSGLGERFDAISLSAQSADLHRLGLVLQRIATLASDWLQRRPHADLGQILAEMAAAYALAHAKPELAGGTARETYSEVGNIDLMGVAAWPWRTQSGYEGLTVLFRDMSNDTWNTWTEARASSFARDFSAAARYHQPGPWDGAESPSELVRSRFRLIQAKRNRWGRLSSSAASRTLISGPADLAALPSCTDWSRIGLHPLAGLQERDPRNAIQLVMPSAWHRQPFDPVKQCLVWQLEDSRGQPLTMSVAFDELSRPVIEHLERLSDAELEQTSLLGRCTRTSGRMYIQPLALIRGGKATLLHFPDTAPPAKPAPSGTAEDDAENTENPEEGETDARAIVQNSAAAQFILATISALEWLAESGTRSPSAQVTERITELSDQAAALGLGKLHRILVPQLTGGDILRLRWLMTVLQQAAASA